MNIIYLQRPLTTIHSLSARLTSLSSKTCINTERVSLSAKHMLALRPSSSSSRNHRVLVAVKKIFNKTETGPSKASKTGKHKKNEACKAFMSACRYGHKKI